MNFRRILSKSSVKSSSSALGKGTDPSEEISRLQGEVELLKQSIESMKISVESRDSAIGTLAREKEKLYVELKSVQRINRNLHQQLLDERDMYSKEKDFFNEEMKRLKKNNTKEYIQQQESLNDDASNSSLREEIKAKDEVIYNICTKYIKIKTSKQQLQRKCQKLEKKSQKVCENVMLLLRQNKFSVDSIIQQVIKAPGTPPSSKKYLKLLKLNSNLHFENTELKVCLSIKDFSEKMKVETINREIKSHLTKLFKSEGKIEHCKSIHNISMFKPSKTNIPYRQYHAKFHKIRERGSSSKFNGIIHELFSPYFRRKMYFHSDPCLVDHF